MLDMFLGVENIGVDSKIKCLCWPRERSGPTLGVATLQGRSSLRRPLSYHTCMPLGSSTNVEPCHLDPWIIDDTSCLCCSFGTLSQFR